MSCSFGVGQASPPPRPPSFDQKPDASAIPGPEGVGQPRIRWHHTFFVLAAIGIAAITASLSFSRALTEDFAQAVASNYEWVEREALYSELVKLAGECAQPGVNVFNSRDADAERARLTASLTAFRSRLDIARREARVNLPAADLKDVETRLDRIAAGISRVESESRHILDLSRQSDYEQAGQQLSGLNQVSSGVSDEIVSLYSGIRTAQSQRFESQLQDAERLRAYQVWFLLGILGMVLVVAYYGNRLSRAAHATISTIATQARNLADREARLRTIFNTAAEGIITINEQGIVESCNQATLDLFQQPADQIIGAPLDDLMERSVPPDADPRSARIRDVDSLVGTRQELIAYRPDGSRLIADFSAAEVRFSDHRVITGILHDITERKQFEAQLEHARYVAESATRSRTQFLANMSHEIRTPMTSILGYAELLSDPNQTADERSRCIDTIRSNADHLLSLINDILDLSRIEAARMTVETIRCCPVQIVNEVAALMRSRASDQQIDLKVVFDSPIPEFIQSDPVRIRQILINLTGNAVKFTSEGSVRVHLRFDPDSQAEPRIVFRVIDTGIGISPDQQSRLFRPFTQADSSTTRSFGGSGLGLSISKRLVELLGGNISVRSAEGLGATFEFDLTTGSIEGAMVVSPDDVKSVPPESTVPVAVPVKADVLLVEDGEDNRRLFLHHLERAGVQVTCVENGRQAVQTVLDRERPFDLILMDMQMPVMDGYTATRELRRRGYTGRIVALTAHAMSGDREQCLDAGCDDYLTKPIDAARLIETVRAAAQQLAPRLGNDDTGPIISDFADDPEMQRLVGRFVDGLMGRFETLAAAHTRGDVEQVAASAHDLKGSGGGFGFPAISLAAANLEQAARQRDARPADCLSALNELKDVCLRIVAGQPADSQRAAQPGDDLPSVSTDDGDVESLTAGGETRQNMIAEIEELASSDPEWREVSDVLQNLTTILRQSPSNKNGCLPEEVQSAVDAGETVID